MGINKGKWCSARPEVKQWFEKRIKHYEKFAVPSIAGYNAPCFFCGKTVQHINDGGVAWSAYLNYAPNKHVEVLYCSEGSELSQHTGEDYCQEAKEAIDHFLWVEKNSYDIIGYQGITGETVDSSE